MSKQPRVRAIELVRALERAGWVPIRQKGSHVHLRHPSVAVRVTIPMHAGRTLKQGTLAAVLEQAGVTAEELQDLL